MKVLIIGGLGYIGVSLVDYIKKTNNVISITVVDIEKYNESGDIMKYKDVNYINAKYQDLPVSFFSNFTDIILLAGQGSVSNSKNLLNVIDNNIRNFAWLTGLLNKDQKLIYASSSSVYGRTDNKEVSENFCKTSRHEPYNYYDWSKQNIDQLCELAKDKLHFYGLRFGTVNGFSRNLRNDVMINSMCFNAKKNGKIFVSKNDVNRPILGIDDLCEAITVIIYKGTIEKSGLYNLNSFNASLFEISSNIAKICNVDCEELTKSSEIVNFKLQVKSYDFKINSSKFIDTFNFEFKDSLESITNNLLSKWHLVENFQNRLTDNFVDYKIVLKCRVCNNITNSLLNVGLQPLANNYSRFCNKLDYNPVHINIEEKYPLHLHYCNECFHVQLNCVVNPEKMFKNYIYVSGTSNTLKEYFENFALNSVLRWGDYAKVIEKNFKTIKILDVGCNDGNQLDAYNRLSKTSNINITTVGVDPAENIYKNISSKKIEHDIDCDFFGKNSVNKLKKKYGSYPFDIIISQNSFPHTYNLNEFLICAKELLSENGILLIQTSQKNMILEHDFDTCYHEHLNFFNTNSMKILCEKNGLFLNNVQEVPIHGISYIFEITKKLSDDSNVVKTLIKEMDQGLYDKLTYTNYTLQCLKYKNNLHNKLIDYKLNNKSIIGFGACAKNMTVLNFVKIDDSIINYIIDENKLKQHLFTPGSNILITDITSLKTMKPNTIILITAWNFYNEILEKIKVKLKEYNIIFPVEICNVKTLETHIINDYVQNINL